MEIYVDHSGNAMVQSKPETAMVYDGSDGIDEENNGKNSTDDEAASFD